MLQGAKIFLKCCQLAIGRKNAVAERNSGFFCPIFTFLSDVTELVAQTDWPVGQQWAVLSETRTAAGGIAHSKQAEKKGLQMKMSLYGQIWHIYMMIT